MPRPVPVEHGTRKAYRELGCRCDSCAEWRRRSMRDYYAQRKAQGRPVVKSKTLYPLVCARCHRQFEATARLQRFCSLSCSNRRGRELVHIGPKSCVAPPVTTTVVSAPKWWGVITSGPCAWCGDQFTATAATARYCSAKCSRAVAKLARGRFLPPPRLRREIYERDGWVCQLCFEPIARDAHYLDDWAPSLDHIEPQSFALLPDHSPENLRTAHRWCNSVRGVNDPNGLFEEV